MSEEAMRGIVKSIRGFGLAALVASAPAAAQVTLNASSWVPPGHPITATMLAPLCADIEKATAGRVKCNILPKAPVGAVQTFDGVKDGLMDLSFVTHGYTPGRFALTDAPEFPFMGDTAEVTAVAYQRIYERMLAGANEHRDVVLLSVFTHGPGQMYNTKRAINTLKDLDGLKIRVGGGLVNEITKNLGAVPMLKPAPVSFALIANQAKWNQIPEADRKAIQPLLGEALARRSGKAWDAADAKGEAAVREAKIPIVIANPQLIAEIKAKTAPLEREWIEKKAKPKGVDGEAVLKALRAEIAVLQKK